MEKALNLVENKNLEHTGESEEKIVNSLSSLSNSNHDKYKNRKLNKEELEKNENESEENVFKNQRNKTDCRSGSC